jgi:CheY-like chemotaxis protein
VDAGFSVVEAHSGEEAAALLDALGPSKVGLVVSDIRMPGMSAAELAALMVDQWPTVPVLLLSGQGGPPTGYPGPFLPKPFATDAFVAAVQMLLPDTVPLRQLH